MRSIVPGIAFSVFLTLFAAFLPTSVHAGPWSRKPGTGEIALSGSYLSAPEVADAQGDFHEYAIESKGVNVYGEYGILPKWSLGFSVTPFQAVATDSFDAVGWSDLELKLTRHLGRVGASVFGVRTTAAIPIGKENPEVAPDYLFAVLGGNGWAFEIMPQWGMGWGGSWFQGGLGLRARSGDRAGQFRYEAMGGHRFGSSKQVGMRLSFTGVAPLDSESNGLPSDQEQYFGFQIGADWRASPVWSLFIQGDGMTQPSKEQPQGSRLNLGLIWKFADGIARPGR